VKKVSILNWLNVTYTYFNFGSLYKVIYERQWDLVTLAFIWFYFIWERQSWFTNLSTKQTILHVIWHVQVVILTCLPYTPIENATLLQYPFVKFSLVHFHLMSYCYYICLFFVGVKLKLFCGFSPELVCTRALGSPLLYRTATFDQTKVVFLIQVRLIPRDTTTHSPRQFNDVASKIFHRVPFTYFSFFDLLFS